MNPSDVISTCGNTCDCETRLLNLSHIKQGQYGMCWFVSVLNTILLSDRLSHILKPYINISSILQSCQDPVNIATHLEKEVSNKSCINDKCSIDTLFDVAKYTIKNTFFREILQEFFSNSQVKTLFGPEDYKTGGHPSHIIMPYLIRLGFPSCNIRHVVFNLNSVLSNLFTDPRKIKLIRLCQEYLQTLHQQCNKNISIFLLSTAQNAGGQIDDIQYHRDFLFLGKFICFISGNKLFVYKLDAAFLISNNNIIRGSGHAICAITCKDKGFIVNSYDPNTINNKTCSVYPYDWYKWDSNNYFYHTIDNSHKCSGGSMIQPSKLTANIFQTKKNEFTFHRNIGNNTFIYVRSIHNITINNNIELLHAQHMYGTPRHQDEQLSYIELLKPYLYLINEVASSLNIFGIVYEFVAYFPDILFSLENSVLIQRGIVDNGMNMYAYKINVPLNSSVAMASLIKECIPDDITIVQSINHPNQFGLYIQYFRSISAVSPLTTLYGRKKNK